MSKKLPPPPSSSSSSTYELLQASALTHSQADPISWSSSKSYRSSPYRQLHHQRGIIGTYTVRLLECRNLTRSHWSVLGLGPVRHLGLSKAVGEVSCYVELRLGWSSNEAEDNKSNSKSDDNNAGNASEETRANVDAFGRSSSAAMVISEVYSEEDQEEEDLDRKPAALPLHQLHQRQEEKQQQQQHEQPDLMSMSLRDAASQQQRVQRMLERKISAAKDGDDDEANAKLPADDTHSNTHVESMHDITDAGNVHNNNGNNAANTNANGQGGIKSGSQVHRSSTVHNNSNPIWPTAQRNGNRSLFAIRLHKRKHNKSNNNHDHGGDGKGGGGSAPSNTDGQRIHLQIVVREEMTGVEHALPDPFGLGWTKGGGAGSRGGTIGLATVDVTDLALGGRLDDGDGDDGKENKAGEDGGHNASGSGGASCGGGVIDAWADLTLPIDNSHTGVARAAAASSSDDVAHQNQATRPKYKCTGRVRVLVSYEPHGMTPRRGDIAALECFARRNPSTSSCRILLPPLSPLRVLEVVGSYCLVEYDLPSSNVEVLTARDRKKQFAQNGHGDRQDQRKNRDKDGSSHRKTGRARIHRNSIFVIERTNAVDGAVNLALAPVDAYLSTPLGRATSQIAGPLLDAAGELVAPAMLTGRLMLASANTVGVIGLNSAGAIVSTVAKSLDSNNEQTLDDRDPLSKV